MREEYVRGIASKDYVRDVARAVGEGRPIQDLGRRAIEAIDADMRIVNEVAQGLQQQIFGIRTLMQLYPDKGGSVTITGASPPATAQVVITSPPATPDLMTPPATVEPNGGLTEAQKLRIMDLAVAVIRERGVKKHIDPDDFLKVLAANGERLNVQQPRSVAGSFLYRARLRVQRNGHDAQGSLLKPAEAGKS